MKKTKAIISPVTITSKLLKDTSLMWGNSYSAALDAPVLQIRTSHIFQAIYFHTG